MIAIGGDREHSSELSVVMDVTDVTGDLLATRRVDCPGPFSDYEQKNERVADLIEASGIAQPDIVVEIVAVAALPD